MLAKLTDLVTSIVEHEAHIAHSLVHPTFHNAASILRDLSGDGPLRVPNYLRWHVPTVSCGKGHVQGDLAQCWRLHPQDRAAVTRQSKDGLF